MKFSSLTHLLLLDSSLPSVPLPSPSSLPLSFPFFLPTSLSLFHLFAFLSSSVCVATNPRLITLPPCGNIASDPPVLGYRCASPHPMIVGLSVKTLVLKRNKTKYRFSIFQANSINLTKKCGMFPGHSLRVLRTGSAMWYLYQIPIHIQTELTVVLAFLYPTLWTLFASLCWESAKILKWEIQSFILRHILFLSGI